MRNADAWCFGAADPNGGTAVLLEVIRIFGDLQSVGWKPLRTIEFASCNGPFEHSFTMLTPYRGRRGIQSHRLNRTRGEAH